MLKQKILYILEKIILFYSNARSGILAPPLDRMRVNFITMDTHGPIPVSIEEQVYRKCINSIKILLHFTDRIILYFELILLL